MLGETLTSFEVAKELVKESINIYNEERPHLSLDYLTLTNKKNHYFAIELI